MAPAVRRTSAVTATSCRAFRRGSILLALSRAEWTEAPSLVLGVIVSGGIGRAAHDCARDRLTDRCAFTGIGGAQARASSNRGSRNGYGYGAERFH